MRSIQIVFSILIVLATAYLISRYGIGSPFSDLGANGFLTEEQRKALENAYGLSGDPLLGFINFTLSLPRGGPPSSIYSKPSLELVLDPFALTVTIVVLAAIASMVVASITFVVNPSALKLLGSVAFVPEYLYAIAFLVTSWYFGWPSPTLDFSWDKPLAYFAIVCLSISSRLAHLIDEMASELSSSQFVMFWKAVGSSNYAIRRVQLKAMWKGLIAFLLTLSAESLERSVMIEYLINFPGIGYFLFTSVLEVDVGLAASSFALLSIAAYALVQLASSVGDSRWSAWK